METDLHLQISTKSSDKKYQIINTCQNKNV